MPAPAGTPWARLTRIGATLLLCALTTQTPQAADLKDVLTGYTVTSWSQKDGLPAGFVYGFAQGDDGYLWIGTTVGLYRFDGVRFTSWDSLSNTALPAGSVRALLAARDGSLWVGLGDGGGIVRISRGKVRAFATADGIPITPVSAIAEDLSGIIWAGTATGLFRFSHDKWERWDSAHGGPDDPVTAVHVTRTNQIMVSTSKAVLTLDPASARTVDVAPIPASTRSIVETSSHLVIVADQFAGFRVVGAPAPASFERARGLTVLHDSKNNVWVGTAGQGLFRVRFNAQGQVATFERATVLTGLLSNGANGLFEDRDGNIWVGSPEGVTRLTPHKAMQITDIGLAAGIGTTSTGTLWVGTVDALLEFPSKTDDTPTPVAHVLPNGAKLRLLHVDQDDELWVATDQGLSQFRGGRFVALPVAPAGDMPRHVDAMTADGTGGLWIADSDRGLLHWRKGSLTAVALPQLAPATTIVSTFTDSTDRAWFGLSDGHVVIASDAGVKIAGPADGADAGVYEAVFEDDRHTIWLAGASGLTRFVDGRFATAHTSTAFPLGSLTAIAQDDSDHLWLGSQTGIVQILRSECELAVGDPNHPVQFRLYDRSDGLAGLPFVYSTNRRAARGRDGRLWFVTSRGLSLIDPRGLLPMAAQAPAHIEALVADGTRHVSDGSAVTVRAGTTRLEFEFTAINLTSPMKQRFRYRLDGFDKDWIDAGSRRQAFYTNLPPRDYRFHVQTTDAEARWTEAGETLELSIPPHIYQTVWFGAALLIGASLIVGGSWRLHVRQVRRQFALLIGERARLSRELHDTLLQSLVGIALQFDALANDPQFTSSESQRREFVRMRRRVEGYIREARQSIADLRSPRLETQDLATALREAVEREVDGRPIEVSFQASGSPRAYPARLEEQMLKIGREAIVNAARHAHADRIAIELESSESTLTLRVTDNGTGFDPDRLGVDGLPHYGLTGMRERAEDIGAEFSIASIEGQGTRVEATVPLQDMPRGRRHGDSTLH